MFLKRKKATNLKTASEGRVGGRDFDDFREDEFGGLNATVDIIWIPELRMRSQYAQEMASFIVTHN